MVDHHVGHGDAAPEAQERVAPRSRVMEGLHGRGGGAEHGHGLDLARAAEERGFESLWLPEHTHIPTSRRSPWPGGGDLPREYWRTHDPFVALATAAAVTTKLKVATGVCLLIERGPIMFRLSSTAGQA